MKCFKCAEKEVIFNARLKDNKEVFIHLVGPECKECIVKGIDRLSLKSRINRFNSASKKISENDLDYLTDIDYKDRFAFGVRLADECPGMGIARYIVTECKPKKAEFAIVILDEYQNLGLGTMMLSFLIKHALENGISALYGYIKFDNIPMHKLLDKFNPENAVIGHDFIYKEIRLDRCRNTAAKILDSCRQ